MCLRVYGITFRRANSVHKPIVAVRGDRTLSLWLQAVRWGYGVRCERDGKTVVYLRSKQMRARPVWCARVCERVSRLCCRRKHTMVLRVGLARTTSGCFWCPGVCVCACWRNIRRRVEPTCRAEHTTCLHSARVRVRKQTSICWRTCARQAYVHAPCTYVQTDTRGMRVCVCAYTMCLC